VERHRAGAGRCRGSSDHGSVPIAEPSLVASSQSAASIGTVWCPSGSSSCGVVEAVRRRAPPFVALSGVQVSRCLCPTCPLFHACPVTGVPMSGLRTSGVRASDVRVRPVGARVGSWSELVAGPTALGSAGERPAAGHRACSDGRPRERLGTWRPGTAIRRVAWSGQASHGWKRRDAPWFPHRPDGFRPLVGEDGMASHQTLRSDWMRRLRSVVIVRSLGPSRSVCRASRLHCDPSVRPQRGRNLQ
jgi:hypothetical protein